MFEQVNTYLLST